MKKILKNKIIKFIFKAAISLGFVAYIIFKVDWTDVLSGILSVSWWQVIIYILILLFGMLISSYKWKILADHKNFKLKLFEYFKFYLSGTFINNFMPSFVGGDAYKAYQLGKKDERFSEAASTVLVDRITGLGGAMMLALFFSILNIKTVLGNSTLIIVNVLIILSLFSDVVIVAMKKLEFWKNIFRKFIPEKVIQLIREISDYGKDRKIIKKAILLAMVYDIVGIALVNYVLFWSLGIHINVLDYLSVIFLTSIVASIPITVNNIGIKEWSYIAFFGAVGVASSPVITVAILSRILQMVVSFLALPMYLKGRYNFRNGLKIK
jgi:uncharacterized protein (TIRG00374 family)